MLDKFVKWLDEESKSDNTIKSYQMHVQEYLKWFDGSFNVQFSRLYRANIVDYISYMLNVKKLKAESFNPKIAALLKFNEYLIEEKLQDDMVVSKKDYIKIQKSTMSPSTIKLSDVENFRQKILESGKNTITKRNYAIVTLLAYSGLRISEALNIKTYDVDLISKEILVRYGKGKKQRLIIINDKIVNAIKEYQKYRDKLKFNDSEYLFISRESEKIDRTGINHIFNKFSDKITPHKLRHFFCSYALEQGWSTHEVAAQVGHSSVLVTAIYSHPSRENMKDKANLL